MVMGESSDRSSSECESVRDVKLNYNYLNQINFPIYYKNEIIFFESFPTFQV